MVRLATGTLTGSNLTSMITPNHGISSVSVLLRKVQIYINFKTVNGFKYKMDYSILIVSMCIEQSTRIKGLKTEDFLTKMPQNLAFLFGAKNGQKSGSKFKKMAQKNQNGENGGERKINPSANPGLVFKRKLLFNFLTEDVHTWHNDNL